MSCVFHITFYINSNRVFCVDIVFCVLEMIISFHVFTKHLHLLFSAAKASPLKPQTDLIHNVKSGMEMLFCIVYY